MSLKQFSQEQVLEMSLIELAYELLVEKNEPLFFNDLVDEIVAIKGSTREQVVDRIAQFYTDLNIDGRFISLGDNRWGLKTWYPVDQVEEEVVHTVKTKKKKKTKKAAILDEGFDVIEDEDEDFEEDIDELDADFDDVDEDDDDELLLEDEEDLDEDLDEDDDDLLEDEDELDEELIEEDFDLDEEEELEEDVEELNEDDEEDKK